MSELSKQALKVDNNTSFPNNNTNYITPSILRAFNVNVIDSVVVEDTYQPFTQSVLESLDALDAFTASLNISFDALDAFTASAQISINALNVNTQSVNNSVSALNTFTASQNGLNSGYTTSINALNSSTASVGSSITQLNASTASQQISINSLNAFTSSTNSDLASIHATTASLQSQLATIGTQSGSWGGGGSVPAGTVSSSAQITSFGFVSGSYETTGRSIVSSSAQITALGFISSSAAIPAGTISGSSQITSLGFVSSSVTASSLVTASFNNGTRNLTFTKGDASTFSVNIPDASGSTLPSGVVSSSAQVVGYNIFATTGSNTFDGNQTITGSILLASALGKYNLNPISGGVSLVASTIAPFSGVSSSAASNTNLFIAGTANTTPFVISGSGNLIGSLNTATGFNRYLTSANIALTAAPNISASMAFPMTVSSNVWSSGPQIRGPISSSTYTLNTNASFGQPLFGTSPTLNFEKAIAGLNYSNNLSITNGGITYTAYKTNLTSQVVIQNNVFQGSSNIDLYSSSLSLTGTTVNTINVQNSYYNPGTANQLVINTSNIFGNTKIEASGANTTTTTGRQFVGNITAGSNNTASLNLNGDASQMYATAIIGHTLRVTGSANLNATLTTADSTYGSAFFGRFNAEDGNRARTAETVFAIGTGTTSTPKTGFLIDSGSNSYFEGTLNVSGSTILQNLTASLQEGYVWVGNSSGKTTTVATSSFGGGGSVPAGTVSSSAQIVGYNIFATTGSNTFNGQQNVYGNVNVLGGNSLNIAANPELSGSPYSNMQLFVDNSTDPTNVYSSIQFVDSFGGGIGALAVNSYTSQYAGNPVFMLVGGGFYSGSDVSIAFLDGRVDVQKPTSFKAPIEVSSSLNVHSGSYNGQAINNITPVSSSQSAVQNIVTLTAAEYALITPIATTLYIVI